MFTLPRMHISPCWGVLPALSMSWEWQLLVGKLFPSLVTASELSGHQHRPGQASQPGLCSMGPVQSSRNAPGMFLLLALDGPNTAFPLASTCNLSGLLKAFSAPVTPGHGPEATEKAGITGPCTKQTQAHWFWLHQKPEQTHRHLRCYTASVPQGGQFLKPKAPLTLESNSSHSFPSIKGN